MFSSFEIIYKFSLQLLLSFWVLMWSIGSWYGIELLMGVSVWQIPASIIGTLIAVVSGIYFYTILSIPYKLSRKFDHIKDKVALETYTSCDDFQKEVADFIIDFFNYPGANVIGGNFHFNNCKSYTKNSGEEILKFRSNTITKFKLKSGKRAVYVPIRIANHELGDMLLIMEGPTLPIFNDIIADFENYFLDDQLYHVINSVSRNGAENKK
ncbi:hypothetical protein EO244_00370 [Ancylomarina salipaludis]|uniref:Uncharacterized protein n=1 Tax=Ancylomarina salipaludis TaxID=2501299 RepID=A0A4Q1JR06_9BACT|nr:hypothetical protein [Ancylomarina salipaludis]RXQ97380.1 hypothetical protein EO244_00370 [Ancylomarina salipaludis]